MKRFVPVGLVLMFAGFSTACLAQASAMLGTWTIDVRDGNPPRAMVVAPDGSSVKVFWGWKGQRLGPIEAKFDDKGELTATTKTNSIVVLSAADQNTLVGTFRNPRGKMSEVSGTRATDVATAEASASERGSTLPGLAAGQTFADEAKDFGVSATKTKKGPPYDTATPTQVPGGRTVTTAELVELLAQEPKPVLIDALGGSEMIESAIGMGNAIGEQRIFGKEREGFPKALERLTGGDKSRAVVFYCRSSSCWHSYNASLHAIDAGYTNVMWYRGGINAWRAAGGKTVPFRRIADW